MKAWIKANWGWIVGYVVWIALFWFVGKPHKMGPFTAFVSVNALNLLYAGLVAFVKKVSALK